MKQKIGTRKAIHTILKHHDGVANPYKSIDLLTAIKWCAESWAAVEPQVIENCWNHAAILPNPRKIRAS